MRLKYRPLAVMGFSTLAVLFICIYISNGFWVVSVAAGVILAVIIACVKKLREQALPVFLCASLLMSGLLFNLISSDIRKTEQFIGKDVVLSGTLVEKPDFDNDRYYYVVKTDAIDKNRISVKIKLSLSDELDIEPYDRLTLKAKIYKIGASSDDIELKYKSKGIFLGAYAYNKDKSDVKTEQSTSKPFAFSLIKLRDTIENRILDKLPNEYGGTVIGMLLGDKDFIDDKAQQSFRNAGIAPLFAVSGLHLSIWVMGLYSVLSLLKVRKKINSAIGIVFAFSFMALTGFSPSVCRSGLMLILMLTGNLFNRKSDSVNSLGFAVLVLCIINPFIAADIGFLLSFTATLGIITIYPQIERLILSRLSDNLFSRVVKAVISAVAVSVSATIGTLPVMIIFIKYISVYSVVTNLLVTYAAGVCMIFGGMSAIMFRIDFLSEIFAALSGIISKYIIFISNRVSSLPHSVISSADIYWKAAVIICLSVLLFTLLTFKGKKFLKVTAVLMSAVIVISSVLSYFHYNDLIQLKVLNVENGIAVIVQKHNEKIVFCNDLNYYYSSSLIQNNLNEINRESADLILVGDKYGIQSSQVLSLIEKQEFKKIIIPEQISALKLSECEAQILINNRLSINLWENSFIDYYCCDDYSAALCTLDGVQFTILFSAEKYADIDDKFLASDYLICSGYIPQCISPSDYKKIILSVSKKKVETIIKYVYKNNGKAVSTAEFGDIRIDIRNSSEKIYIKR